MLGHSARQIYKHRYARAFGPRFARNKVDSRFHRLTAIHARSPRDTRAFDRTNFFKPRYAWAFGPRFARNNKRMPLFKPNVTVSYYIFCSTEKFHFQDYGVGSVTGMEIYYDKGRFNVRNWKLDKVM